ncbi:ABC transporter permease [Cytophaga aurantiaca]|uniref:ABC transporter permease n=1 Tax=Cytophaga aurantiaca TaxID=29530 RepID=UPI00037DD3F0|nr:ABC transporter permease [Cytophaga aurantiaca]
MKDKGKWDIYIQPKSNWFELRLLDVWKYRDLIFMFVKRDFIAQYKQTILGPIWFLIQPLITTIVFIVVFGKIAGLSTDGQPQILFYLSGVLFWNYFSSTFLKISETFLANTNIFSKIYFPRLVVPISVVLSSMISFGIQLILFVIIFTYYLISKDFYPAINSGILLFPILVLIMAALSIGMGIIISSMTIKYRDLRYLVTFGVPLLMYATPIVYPLSSIKDPTFIFLLKLNPMTGIIETFRYSIFGIGVLDIYTLFYSAFITIILLILGIAIFNKVEKNFMDSI